MHVHIYIYMYICTYRYGPKYSIEGPVLEPFMDNPVIDKAYIET